MQNESITDRNVSSFGSHLLLDDVHASKTGRRKHDTAVSFLAVVLCLVDEMCQQFLHRHRAADTRPMYQPRGGSDAEHRMKIS